MGHGFLGNLLAGLTKYRTKTAVLAVFSFVVAFFCLIFLVHPTACGILVP